MNIKKILFIATEPATGMVPYASTIINTLSRDSRVVAKCICVCRTETDYKVCISPDVDAVFLRMPEKKLKQLWYKFWPAEYISAIRKLEREFKPDCVHFLTGEFSLALYLVLFRKSNYYLTVHDLHPHETIHDNFKEMLMEKWIILASKMNRDIIHNLTTSSIEQVEELKKLYPNKNVQYTPFPTLVTNKIASGARAVPELDGIDNYILFFGAVQVYKGINELAKAFKQIEHPDNLKLVIAGKGYMEVEENEDIIRIDRFIDDEEVASLFRNSKFIVYPYLSATMSGVLSIAFYFKKRVLLSDIPFFKQYEADGCVYFKSRDVDDLTERLVFVLSQDNLIVPECYDSFFSERALSESLFSYYQ